MEGIPCHIDRPSTWRPYRSGLCQGCEAGCCQLPVEADAADLVRLGLLHGDEAAGSLKKAARRLIKERVVRSFRAATGLFTLEQKANRDCVFLDENRRCRVYDKRPEVCRRFPTIGPRPGFCPAKKSLPR